MPTDSPAPEESPLTAALKRAQRGFRSDVAPLIDLLDQSELYIPLLTAPEGIPEGQQVTPNAEVHLVPQLLSDGDGQGVVPLFSKLEVLESAGEHFQWCTDDGPLAFATFPMRTALKLALQMMDDRSIQQLVLDVMSESELALSRSELSSLLREVAIPLVGYVEALPADGESQGLTSELSEPPSEPLQAAIQGVLATEPCVSGFRLAQTFDAERDLEPHLTLTVELGPGEFEPSSLAQALFAAVEGKLPPPGYLDLVFTEGADPS